LQFYQTPCRREQTKSAQTQIRSSRSKALEKAKFRKRRRVVLHLLNTEEEQDVDQSSSMGSMGDRERTWEKKARS
jgi:hypothetical protein